jgi:hypothetical protein
MIVVNFMVENVNSSHKCENPHVNVAVNKEFEDLLHFLNQEKTEFLIIISERYRNPV